jgi:hypothetical protein
MKHFLSICLVLVMLGTVAHATTLQKLTDEAMTYQSDVIAHGHVKQVRSARLGGQLVTLAEIETEEILKGAPQSVTVIVPGGVDMSLKHPVATIYPGSPQLLVGQELFLFLEQSELMAGGYTVVGFSQGALQVFHDSVGSSARRNLSNVNLVTRSGVVRGSDSAISLETLKEQVRGYLAANAASGS